MVEKTITGDVLTGINFEFANSSKPNVQKPSKIRLYWGGNVASLTLRCGV